MKGTARISKTLAAAALGAMIAMPAAAQVLKVTPDFDTRATSLIGHVVTDPQGHSVGKIDNLLIKKNGQVGFIVLSVARRLGIGAKMVALPFDKVSAQGDKIFYKGTSDDLKNAAEFTYEKHAMIDQTPQPDRVVDAEPLPPLGQARAMPAAQIVPRPDAVGPPTSLMPPLDR